VLFGAFVLTLVMGSASRGWAGGLTLTIRDGRVSLDAQDVTIRQILMEWSRVGKTQIVNLERVNSGPLTLKFEGLSEDEALDIILRSLPGYVAAPRTASLAGASMYDRILIMATTTPVAALPQTTRPQSPSFGDFPGNVTQLRAAPPLSPGVLPEPPEDPRQSNDPAIAAAAAAGLTVMPMGQPTQLVPPQGVLQPPVRNAGASTPAPQPQGGATTAVPANPWNAPPGTARPGLAPPPPAPSTTPPPNRLTGGARPQQADQ